MVGTILLDMYDNYVDDEGNLPSRPPFDKELLKAVIKGNTVTKDGEALLPDSLLKVAKPNKSIVPITIRELANADVLIVVRSNVRLINGKKFRLDNFKRLNKGTIQIYIRK